ncbi:hypothetical protein Mic7113_4002 [Allocoleopsis franciscana PCC 7113]|uniref:Uncharacterized protein n=1 Tax=Allocoleopsis franciscana PCC 7113 TaxID=1173027 RepID=K9WJK7_9CYAN|nr:hypothetical protein Mic7113_4002 [Allocoleopsis franciscana PCC 7113]
MGLITNLGVPPRPPLRSGALKNMIARQTDSMIKSQLHQFLINESSQKQHYQGFPTNVKAAQK